MRIPAILLLACLLSPLAVSQEIYRWVDKNGVVHYSDQPGPGAERVTITGTAARPPAAQETPALYQSDPQPQPVGAPTVRAISISSPAMDEAFFGTDATVPVAMALDGELQTGHEVVLFLDGRRVATDGLSATLTGVSRGTHFLRAAVLDPSGNPVVTSPQIMFHVQQASVASPPVGPALRPPPPRPTPRPSPSPRAN
ncbi:MAG: DUF4124 domain-containing protein [Steroidobacteraceae bacterium]|jgi:hypothetical protein|nr:DUF4124 domain-containing protein [Steroidobacteraceae bacterium]